MRVTRRDGLKAAALALAAPLSTASMATQISGSHASLCIGLAVSTYSYRHLRNTKYPVEQVIDDAARLGFDGVEILHRQMTDESPAYVRKLKQAAFRNGLALPMLSIHQDFIYPPRNGRKTSIIPSSASS